jgi:polyglutamine-binding protein 1
VGIAVDDAAHKPAPLPPGWHESFDPLYQTKYYFNYWTAERAWTKPEWTPTAVSVAAPSATSTPAPALPASARWEKAIDPARGKPYFYNHATKESAWTLPEGATLLEEAIAAAAPPTATADLATEQKKKEESEEGEFDPTVAAKGTKSPQTTQPGAEETLETKTATREKDKVEEHALPPGWAQAIDPIRGTTYYYNETLSVTQWDHPGTSVIVEKFNDGVARSSGQGGNGAEKLRSEKAKRTNQKPALDPMDPSSYSDTPRGGWGAGLGKETAM